LEITRLGSFISGNTQIETRHFYWILTSPSFAVQYPYRFYPLRSLGIFYHRSLLFWPSSYNILKKPYIVTGALGSVLYGYASAKADLGFPSSASQFAQGRNLDLKVIWI
jgi:hypothetical protein